MRVTSIPGRKDRPGGGVFYALPALFFCAFFGITRARAETPAYLAVPPAARPLDNRTSSHGVTSPMGMLQINSTALQRSYNANLQTGQVEIVEYVRIGNDTTDLWTASYPAINDYTSGTRDLLLRRRWMLEFIDKEDAASSGEPGTFIFDLPFRIPDWMKRVGVDKPKLTINGSYKLVTEGSRKTGPGAPYSNGSWFPKLTLDQQPAFAVKGTIGRLVSVEINSEQGLSDNLQDQMKVSYKGEGDELEDDIIQEVEAGNTSLSLTGTELTGYTEEHKGLFGVKIRAKIGNLEITGIASQEGGSQERQKLGAGTQAHEFPLEDKAIDFYRHFWLRLSDRSDYGNPNNWLGNFSAYTQGARNRGPVEVFRQLNAGEVQTIGDTAVACAYDQSGISQFCEGGHWKQLVEGIDFTYDEELRMLSVAGGTRDMVLSVRWTGDFLDVQSGFQRRDPGKHVLIYSRNHQDNPFLDPLMWRNVYAIGKVTAQDRDNFKLTVSDNEGRELGTTDSISFVRKLGLEKRDLKGSLDIDNKYVFKLDEGYLVLPCLSNAVLGYDTTNCLTPMKRVTSVVNLYKSTIEEVQNGPTASHFTIFGKQRQSTFDVRENSFAAAGQKCNDINPGTEKLVLNGSTVLKKDLDYQVVYETGQISLISARARDPNADLDISYECNPPFQIQDKILMGTRMEYKLDNISDQSLIGATVLYKSQSTTEKQPELGSEPFSHLLLGMNTRLAGEPKWMTKFANLFPFVHTEAPSKINFEFEIAHSIYNPNTKNSAYVDNFDFSQNTSTLPMTYFSWTEASPPAFGDDGRPDDNLDYRHQGQLVWHSSFTQQYAQIYGNTGNSYTNSREQTILKMQFQPNDNLEGNSWGGIMRAFPQGLSDQSRKSTLDVVVQGQGGTLYADLGRISEDLSLPGQNNGAPNGQLNSEVNEQAGDYVNRLDAGLDGVASTAGETGVRWECKPSCYAIPIPSDNTDPGLDDYAPPQAGATEQTYQVDGTEGNNKGTEGVAYDTEDLDHSGTLDTLNRFLRYPIPLDSACTPQFYCQDLSNGWRKYQIPLYGTGKRIDPSNTETEQSLLANGKILRLWLGHLPKRVARTDVLLALVNIDGNTWEGGDRNTNYQIDNNRFGSGDLGDSAFISVPPTVSDSNTLRVDVINQQEERGYKPSPNTPQERDSRTGEPLPERALVLKYDNLHPGESVHATRILASDVKDFTRYSQLKLEVHGDSDWVPGSALYQPGQNRVSFGLQLGRDLGNGESQDYYEIKLHIDTTAMLDPAQKQLWLRNSFSVNLSDLTGLKNDPLYRAYNGRFVSQKAYHEGRGDSSLTLSVTGNPNLGTINWMRLVIYVDSGAVQRQQGEIWVNDLRLDGVDKSSGTAIRSQIQLDFADFINASANLQYTNGNFATLSETKATPATATTRVDYNSNLSLFANKFMPDEWGVSLPITLQYTGSLDRPFTQPFSDLQLGGTGFFDIARDLLDGKLSSVHNTGDSLKDIDSRYARVYQTTNFSETFSTSYHKEMRTKSFFTRALLERPGLEYRFSGTQHSEYYSDAQTLDYKYRMTYNLSPYQNKTYHPFEDAAKLKFIPDGLAKMDFTPLPDKVNLILADYSFVRDETETKPRTVFDPVQVTPDQYNVQLSHGLDMEWKPLSFFNFGYRIDINRDFDQDHKCFDGPSLVHGGCGGLLASGLIFDLDDKRYGSGKYYQKTSPTDSFMVDTTHYGGEYGILARERNRTQSFHSDVTANPFTWLSAGAGFNSGYQHTWINSVDNGLGSVVPAHFNANADHEIKLTSSLNLSQLTSSLGNVKPIASEARSVQKTLDAYRVRSIDITYTVDNKYNNEAFTYGYLKEKGVTAGQLLAYQFGFIYSPSNLASIFTGVPNAGFFDYLSEPDSSLGTSTMNHIVNRALDVESGFTIPLLALDLTGGMKYSKQYTLYRNFQSSDTTVIWPEITVTGSFADFAGKIPFLRSRLKSLTAYTSYNYRQQSTYNLFSPSPDIESYTHTFAPLIRLSGTAKNDMRIEVSFNTMYSEEIQYGKVSGDPAQPLTYLGAAQPTVTTYVRDPALASPKRTLACGVEPTLSWELETQKGIQFWRYYFRLKNNLRLTLNSAANYLLTETEQSGHTTKQLNEINAMVKPAATYNFTTNVDAQFWILYSYEQHFETINDEYTHEIALHGEFTMRF